MFYILHDINQRCLIRNTVCPLSDADSDPGWGGRWNIFVFHNLYIYCGLLSRPLDENCMICDL